MEPRRDDGDDLGVPTRFVRRSEAAMEPRRDDGDDTTTTVETVELIDGRNGAPS